MMKYSQRFQNMNSIYVDERRKIYTETKFPVSVYGENIVKFRDKNLRTWDPSRSKLGAAICKGIPEIGFNESSSVLYLGSASGTTVSHVSDIAKKGIVYAVDFAPRVMRDLMFLAKSRDNIVPLIYDAKHPENYSHLLKPVDFVFQDIAQKEQVLIFERNIYAFLKKGNLAMLSVKSRSIDVAKKPKEVFAAVREELSKKFKIIDSRALDPFEDDHMIFLCRYV
jgi:fibrillarin-like pre-rRNA processing protein